MAAAPQRVLVTGGNAGIGFALCKQLLSERGCHVYLGSRSLDKGKVAVDEILKECPEAVGRLDLVQIDVSSSDSVAAAAETVKGMLGDAKLYGLVNNAGTGLGHGVQPEDVVQTNLYGPKLMVEAFVSLIDSTKGRIVNVGSGAGPMWLAKQDEATRGMLASPDVSWEQVEEIAKTGLSQGSEGNAFFIYGMSKACLHAYTRILSKQFPHIRTSAISPGFIQTNMTKNMGATKLPEEGTVALKRCLFDDDLPGNGFYYGSDGLRSPVDKYRDPGEPEYQGD